MSQWETYTVCILFEIFLVVSIMVHLGWGSGLNSMRNGFRCE